MSKTIVSRQAGLASSQPKSAVAERPATYVSIAPAEPVSQTGTSTLQILMVHLENFIEALQDSWYLLSIGSAGTVPDADVILVITPLESGCNIILQAGDYIMTSRRTSRRNNHSEPFTAKTQYHSVVTEVEGIDDEDYYNIIVRHEIDVDGSPINYPEYFSKNEKNPRTKKLLMYLSEKGITYDNLEGYVGCEETITMSNDYDHDSGKAYWNIATREMLNIVEEKEVAEGK